MLAGSDDERSKARRAVRARLRSGWSETRALDEPLGTRRGPPSGAYARRTQRAAAMESIAGVRISTETRYEDDLDAQRLVAEHPDGMTLDQVGVTMGVTRERIRQIEAKALESLALRCQLAGITREDVLEMLSRKPSQEGGGHGGGGGGQQKTASGIADWRGDALPVEPWSEHGLRVEAACAEMDAAAARLTATLVRVGRGA